MEGLNYRLEGEDADSGFVWLGEGGLMSLWTVVTSLLSVPGFVAVIW